MADHCFCPHFHVSGGMDVDDERYKIKGQRPSQKGKGATNEQNTSVDQKPPVEQQLHSGESEEAMVITRGMER